MKTANLASMRLDFLELLHTGAASIAELETFLDECRMRLVSYRRVESTMPPPETRRSGEML